jgi:tRNA(His) guanylyltransferase
MKTLEAQFDQTLMPELPYVIRLDGNSFKQYTTGMVKPFDGRLTCAFIRTMNDLLHYSNAVTGFTQSDEITLIFAAEPLQANMTFAGRMAKIQSIYASIASARFNHYMRLFDWTDRSSETANRVTGGHAFFDARAFSVPDDATAMEGNYHVL